MATFSLHHIHHETADVDSTVAFYQKHFKGELTERTVRDGVQWARLKLGDVMMNVTNRGEKNVDLVRYNGLDHIGLHTSDFDETITELEASGVNFFVKPMSPAPGVRIAFINGPDNIKIELLHIES